MRMSSAPAHTGQVRVLVAEDHVALADRIGEGLRDAGSDTVAVTLARLRRKLGDPPLIETVTGVGYRL